MLRAHLQHIITELLRGMAIVCAVSANFKEFFISGQLIVIPFIPLFRYFVILHFTDSRFSSSPSFFYSHEQYYFTYLSCQQQLKVFHFD